MTTDPTQQAADAGQPAPTVKPSRDEFLRVIRRAIGDWEGAVVVGDLADVVTDEALALLPGRTEAEVAVDVMRELASLVAPHSGIALAQGATRVDVSAWLASRADRLERGEGRG